MVDDRELPEIADAVDCAADVDGFPGMPQEILDDVSGNSLKFSSV
jgi:hypothetical protein